MSARKDDWSPDPSRRDYIIDQELADLFRATRPADPDEAVWEAMRQRLQSASVQPISPQPRHPRAWRWGAAAAACAAAILLAVAYWPRPQPGPAPLAPAAPQAQVKSDEVEVFEVATGDEIEILHVRGADLSTLLLIHAPLPDALLLAAQDDVTFNAVNPPPSNNLPKPEVRIVGEGQPMVWAETQKD